MLSQIFLLFFCLQTIHGESDVVSLTASNLTVLYNEEITLNCHLILNSTLDNSDTTVELAITNSSGALLANYTSNNKNATTMINVFHEIKHTDITDKGIYTCTVTIDDVIEESVAFFLNVTGFSLMATTLSDISVSLSETIRISCAFNHNMVIVAWSRYGSPLVNGGERGFNITTVGSTSWLTFTNAGYNDMGAYQCTGTLMEYTGMTQTNLIINEYVPLYINTSRYELNKIKSIVSNSVNGLLMLTCDIYGVPQPDYIWMKGKRLISNYTNEVIGPYVSNGSLIIPTNSLPTNSGDYTCYGIHRINHLMVNSISLSYNITVLPAVEKEPFNWYILAIALIIAVTLVLMFVIGVYFVAANTDICFNNEKRRMKRMERKLKKQLKTQELADDEFGFYAPDTSYHHANVWNDSAEETSLTSDDDNSSTVGLVNAVTEEEDILEEQDNESYGGTFIRKQTIPKLKKDLKSSFNAKKGFIRPVITLPPVTSDTPLAVELLPDVPSEQEIIKPVESDNSIMHYMETVYTPPPPLSDSSDEESSERPIVTNINNNDQPNDDKPLLSEDGRHYMETVYTPPPPPSDSSDDEDYTLPVNNITAAPETSDAVPVTTVKPSQSADDPVQSENGMYFMETLYTPPPHNNDDSEDDEIPYELTNLATTAGPIQSDNILPSSPLPHSQSPNISTHTDSLQVTQIDNDNDSDDDTEDTSQLPHNSQHYMETLYTPPPNISSDDSDDDSIPINIQNLAGTVPVTVETSPQITKETIMKKEVSVPLKQEILTPAKETLSSPNEQESPLLKEKPFPAKEKSSPVKQTTPPVKKKVLPPTKEKLSKTKKKPSTKTDAIPTAKESISPVQERSSQTKEVSKNVTPPIELSPQFVTAKKDKPQQPTAVKKVQPKQHSKKQADPVVIEPPSEPVKSRDGTVYMETVYIPPPDVFTDDEEEDEIFQEELAKNLVPKTTTPPEQPKPPLQHTTTTEQRNEKITDDRTLSVDSSSHTKSSESKIQPEKKKLVTSEYTKKEDSDLPKLRKPKPESSDDTHKRFSGEKSVTEDYLRQSSVSNPRRKSATEDSLKKPSASDPRRKSYSGDSLKRLSGESTGKKPETIKASLSVEDTSREERRKSWDLSLGRKKKGDDEKVKITKEAKKSEKAFKKSKKSTSSFATADIIY